MKSYSFILTFIFIFSFSLSVHCISKEFYIPSATEFMFPTSVYYLNTNPLQPHFWELVGAGVTSQNVWSSQDGTYTYVGPMTNNQNSNWAAGSGFNVFIPTNSSTSFESVTQRWRVQRNTNNLNEYSRVYNGVRSSPTVTTLFPSVILTNNDVSAPSEVNIDRTFSSNFGSKEEWNSGDGRIAIQVVGGENNGIFYVNYGAIRFNLRQTWTLTSGPEYIRIDTTSNVNHQIEGSDSEGYWFVEGTGFIDPNPTTMITSEGNGIIYKVRIGSAVFDAIHLSETRLRVNPLSTAIGEFKPNAGGSRFLSISVDNGVTWTDEIIEIPLIECLTSLDCPNDSDGLFCNGGLSIVCSTNNNTCIDSPPIECGDNSICSESERKCISTLSDETTSTDDPSTTNLTPIFISAGAVAGLALIAGSAFFIARRSSSSSSNDSSSVMAGKNKKDGSLLDEAVYFGYGEPSTKPKPTKSSPRASPVRKGSPDKADRNGSPQKTETKMMNTIDEDTEITRKQKTLSGISQLSDASVVLTRIKADHDGSGGDFIEADLWTETPSIPSIPSVSIGGSSPSKSRRGGSPNKTRRGSPTKRRGNGNGNGNGNGGNSPEKSRSRAGSSQRPRAGSRSASKRGTRTRAGSKLAVSKGTG